MPRDPGADGGATRRATRWGTPALGAAAAVLCCWAPIARAADSVPISPAETMLFMVPHLETVKPPRRLHYTFEKSGTLEQGFSDTVDLDITAATDGTRKAATRYFSDERRIEYPEQDKVEGNPVLMYYLEGQLKEMTRLTTGKGNYFRHLIRTALAESAQIKDVDIRYGGRQLRARQITISPYRSAPSSGRYARLAGMQYVFTLSDEIPGRIYQLRAWVPPDSGSDKDEPVLQETLTFQSDAPLH